tara:strand:- start:100 stop:816 length:717 start_codon:yes stop_codon:yes gene_type:complete
MKIVAAILVTAVVSAAVTYLVAGKTKTVEVERIVEVKTNDQDKQIADLTKKLKAAEAEAGRVEVIETGVAVPGAVTGVITDPADLIDKLAADEMTGEDTESQRRLIHYFESLVDAGDQAVPAINAFLDSKVDREFGRQSFRQQMQITNTQMDEMKKLSEKHREVMGTKMREIWGNQEISMEEKRDEMRAYFTKLGDEYKSLMTDEQKAQMDEMGDDGFRSLRSMMGWGWGGRDRGGRR